MTICILLLDYYLIKNLKFIFSYEFLKRNLDILFALFTIILLLPLFILIYLLILFLDNGPVIFKQLRVGKNGEYFTIYKFRTMKYIKDYKFDGLKNELSKETIKKAREKFKTTKKYLYQSISIREHIKISSFFIFME